MADQNIHFEDISGGDTGERAATAAILPYVAGEKVKAAILNRPLENLRGRTEVLRTDAEDLLYYRDMNTRWLISAGDSAGVGSGHSQPKVTWNHSTGIFSLVAPTTEIVIQPIMSPKTDKKATITYILGAPGAGYITFTTSRYGYEGGSRQQIVWSEAATGGLGVNNCLAVCEGNPQHILHITIADNNTTTYANILAALPASGYTSYGFEVALIGGSTGDTIEYNDIVSTFTAEYTFLATQDREMHYLTQAQIAAFFADSTTVFTDGDTVGIWYEYSVDPASPTTKGGRRQATPSSSTVTPGAPNTEVTSGQLFVSSTYPERIPLSIPICKRVGDDLIFIDGTIVRGDELDGFVYFGSSGYTNYTLGTTTLGSSGSLKIGVAAHTAHAPAASEDTVSLAAGTLQTALEDLQTLINEKASLDVNEAITAQWLLGNTLFCTETVTTAAGKLLWRSGTSGTPRPGDAQVGWQTISKYMVYTAHEYTYITLQGGYISYNGSLKIHTPATGTGNIVITFESAGSLSAYLSNNNVRGTYRRYNATANTEYPLFPTSTYMDCGTSGFGSTDDSWYLWGVGGDFTAAFAEIILTATTKITVDTVSLEIEPHTDANVAGETYKVSIHAKPKYASAIIYGSHTGKINRVIDGLKVVPAATAGQFAANTITLTPGRAYVGGNLVTVAPIVDGDMVVLTNVSVAAGSGGHRTDLADAVFYPASASLSKWYGVWLRSDGVFRVGNLPDMGLHTDLPGYNGYLIPQDDVESSFHCYDYTLVDIVWCYDYAASNQIRFAGMTHLGGGLHVYHQARVGTYPDASWAAFTSHEFITIAAEQTSIDPTTVYISTNNNNILPGAIPGIPTNISGAALLGVYVKQRRLTASVFYAALLHSNTPLVDAETVSTSKFAPPIRTVTGDPASSLYVATNTSPAETYSTYPIWMYSRDAGAISEYNTLATNLIYPLQRTGAGNVGRVLVQFTAIDFTTGDYAYLHVTNLGFYWDRYNPGGIY
jgi:hypothetical protein